MLVNGSRRRTEKRSCLSGSRQKFHSLDFLTTKQSHRTYFKDNTLLRFNKITTSHSEEKKKIPTHGTKYFWRQVANLLPFSGPDTGFPELRFLAVFFSPSRHIPAYIKLGHDDFLAHPIQFANQPAIGILHTSYSELLIVSLNEKQMNTLVNRE
jgi:hypothetical protein